MVLGWCRWDSDFVVLLSTWVVTPVLMSWVRICYGIVPRSSGRVTLLSGGPFSLDYTYEGSWTLGSLTQGDGGDHWEGGGIVSTGCGSVYVRGVTGLLTGWLTDGGGGHWVKGCFVSRCVGTRGGLSRFLTGRTVGSWVFSIRC